MSNKLEFLFHQIVKDCLNLIQLKAVNLEDLAFELGISYDRLNKALTSCDKDFSIYFRAYDLLLDW
ncbi:MAG: hypothetical protein V8Q75_04680 [Bacilli bacterium]